MAYTPAPPPVRRRRSSRGLIIAVSATAIVMTAIVVVAFVVGARKDEPAGSRVTDRPTAEQPAPVADVAPIEEAFRTANAGEGWYDWVEGMQFTGDLLVVSTTLDDHNQSKAGYFICTATAAAVADTGTEGVRKIIVRSRGNVTLAGREGTAATCWD